MSIVLFVLFLSLIRVWRDGRWAKFSGDITFGISIHSIYVKHYLSAKQSFYPFFSRVFLVNTKTLIITMMVPFSVNIYTLSLEAQLYVV